MGLIKIAYFSAHALEIPNISSAVLEYKKKIGEIKVIVRTGTQLLEKNNSRSFINFAVNSHFIIITLHGGKASCPIFEELIKIKGKKNNNTPYLFIHPIGGDEEALSLAQDYSDFFGTEKWYKINQYLLFGGSVNFKNLFIYLYNLLFDKDVPYKDPIKLPHEGIYHPDLEEVIDIEEYLKKRFDPQKITVGLWFHQGYWVNSNLEHIDAIIREVESQGANIIPVFHLRYKDKDRGNKGADYVANRFFIRNGVPIIDVLINPMLFSLTLASPDYKEILKKLNVPFIQAITTLTPYSFWKESAQGISTMDVSYTVAQPEFDGAIITVPVATREEKEIDPVTGGLLAKYVPIKERVKKMVSLALNWAKLRKKSNKDKKIAIIFHNYPPRNDRIGCAAGLDSFESVRLLIDRMKKEGYRVDRLYKTKEELTKEILGGLTCDRRWLSIEKMAEKSQARADENMYKKWNEELPPKIRKKMKEDWGAVPGDLFVYNKEMLFPGIINGNLFITVQPPRGYLEDIDKIYHDMYLSPPHHYLAFYRWIKEVFKADAVIHVGKHGSLEWLPGKALGLSEECYPDLSIMDIPNLYIYIVNDPSEGTQAKRRSYCCILDHLTPAFTNADFYDDLAKVENLIKDYFDAKTEDPNKLSVIKSMLWEAVKRADLDKDLGITEKDAFSNFDSFIERVHSYLSEISNTMINDGLHVFGTPPENDRLTEFLVQMTRLPNGEIPSFRESLALSLGLNIEDVYENKGKIIHSIGKTGAEVLRILHDKELCIIEDLRRYDFDTSKIEEVLKKYLNQTDKKLREVLDFICEDLVIKIKKTTDEMDFLISALDGKFVPPGPSGAPTRGQAYVLPTGRNFYSVDPNKIPSEAAWEVGKKLGDALIEKCLKETGKFPENIGIIVWGGPTMRTKGDDIAEILYLMGVKPVWAKDSGNVVGLEIIPLADLGRPRLDVTPRISGFFRDSFPNLVELIDEAVRMVANLKESEKDNFIRAHVLKDLEEYKKLGMSEEEAFREATYRIFGCPPGTYGAGVEELIEAKDWKEQKDLAEIYINYSSFAYGKGGYGVQRKNNFKKLLSRMDVAVKNEDSREYDVLSCTDYYNYFGGLIVASKIVRGESPLSLVGDTSDPRRVKINDLSQETKHVLRARLLNPKWLEGMKRHGYKGAGDISHAIDTIFGWDATTEVIEDWMYERIAQRFVFDPKTNKWIKEVNPYALQNILEKLLEAISRGMWKADKEVEERLKREYLKIEGTLEDIND